MLIHSLIQTAKENATYRTGNTDAANYLGMTDLKTAITSKGTLAEPSTNLGLADISKQSTTVVLPPNHYGSVNANTVNNTT